MKLCYIVCYISKLKLFACWEIVHAFLSSAVFFQNQLSRKKYFRNTIRVSNSLDPDQARPYVGPDQGPKCFQRLSAEDISRQRVNNSRSWGFRSGFKFQSLLKMILEFGLVS